MAKRKHTMEERVQAVREYLEEGKDFSELSEKYRTPAQVVRSWVRQFRQERQYEAVRWAAEEQGYPVAEACRALHISQTGYYQWRSGKAGARTVENRHLAGLVKQIHDESPDKGYRQRMTLPNPSN